MTYIDSIQNALATPAERQRIIIVQGVPAEQIQDVVGQIQTAVGQIQTATGQISIKTRPAEPTNRDFFPEFHTTFDAKDPNGVLFIVSERVFSELEWQRPDNSLRSLLANNFRDRISGSKQYFIETVQKGGVVTIIAEKPDYYKQISRYFPSDYLDPYVSVHSFGTDT